ncbi:MAG: thiamine diphosphokinase [Mesorhizobium sp.]|nr:thiamine diphosphokinase [Mesorhizobium sp.]MCO5161721.1 thiamine diphosphokinase [Mesorhizobium sp.]
MSLFAVLLGGELTVTPRVAALSAGARVVAADSGIRQAAALGVVPELWVGDFDSSSAEDFEKHRNVPRQTFPAAKDKTDGELAIDIAIARGASSLLILGAFGGERADHEFLHLALALRLAERGFDVILSSGIQEGRPVLPGRHSFDYAYGTLFSILGFTDISGLSIEGAEWPLDRIHMEFGSSLTISNRVTGPLSVSLESGRALLVAQTLDRS